MVEALCSPKRKRTGVELRFARKVGEYIRQTKAGRERKSKRTRGEELKRGNKYRNIECRVERTCAQLKGWGVGKELSDQEKKKSGEVLGYNRSRNKNDGNIIGKRGMSSREKWDERTTQRRPKRSCHCKN